MQSVDRHTCRTPHFLSHAQSLHSFAHGHHAHAGLKSSRVVPLRAMSHALTHFTPSICTPSSPVLVPLPLIHCEDPLPPQGGASAELPLPTGYEPNRIVDNLVVDNQENRNLAEDQITELEDRVKSLSYNQSFLPSTHDSAESIATPPESDFDDEQLRTLLASPLYLQERSKCRTITSSSL